MFTGLGRLSWPNTVNRDIRIAVENRAAMRRERSRLRNEPVVRRAGITR
jgi:hypothetical protein